MGFISVQPLKIALIVKNETNKRRLDRNMGYFSYPVPEFEWEHFTPGKRFSLARSTFKNFDLIIHEDAPLEANWHGAGIPLIFLDIDSTLSIEHFRQRFNQAKQADLILVDHDDLKLFKQTGKPVVRLSYCVNDKVFYPKEAAKSLDLVYHCSNGFEGGDKRREVRQILSNYAKANFLQFRSGAIALDQYADNFRSALVAVNQSRNSSNRPHRILDVLASQTCLLTSDFAYVAHDGLQEQQHYLKFCDESDLILKLDYLFNNRDVINRLANSGYNLINQNHTWAIRAKELREIIQCKLSV